MIFIAFRNNVKKDKYNTTAPFIIDKHSSRKTNSFLQSTDLILKKIMMREDRSGILTQNT